MRTDEAHLRLTIDVHYELGRTSILDLERVLIEAADHLAANGMLSGETEASVLTWDSGVLEIASDDARTATTRRVVESVGESLKEMRLTIPGADEIEQIILAAVSVRDNTEQERNELADWALETRLRTAALSLLLLRGLVVVEWQGDEPVFRKKA